MFFESLNNLLSNKYFYKILLYRIKLFEPILYFRTYSHYSDYCRIPSKDVCVVYVH